MSRAIAHGRGHCSKRLWALSGCWRSPWHGFRPDQPGQSRACRGRPRPCGCVLSGMPQARHDQGEQVAVAGSLRGLAVVAAGIGQFEDAARLFGAAEGLRETIGLPLRDTGAGTIMPSPRREPTWVRTSGTRQRSLGANCRCTWRSPRLLRFLQSGRPRRPPAPTGSLTGREVEVLQLLVAGYTDQRIAETLFVSRRTANTHVQHIYGKLGVNSRAEAAAAAVRRGLVPTSPTTS